MYTLGVHACVSTSSLKYMISLICSADVTNYHGSIGTGSSRELAKGRRDVKQKTASCVSRYLSVSLCYNMFSCKV